MLGFDALGRLALGQVSNTGLNAYTLTAAPASFSLTGIAAQVLAARSLPAVSRSFALTGVAAGLLAARRAVAAPGPFTLTGVAANLRRTAILQADVRGFVLTGIAATLTKFAGAYTVAAATGSFILTGIDAEFSKSSIHTNPVIMMSWSDDGGITWSTESSAAIGRNGDYKRKIKFRRLGVTGRRGRTFRFRASAAVMRGFLGCAIDVEKLNTAGTQPQPGMR